MSISTRFIVLSIALVGCVPTTQTDEEIVPIYESPCDVFDAGAACTAPPDENGAYIAAWQAARCEDVCNALNESEPYPVLACDPVRLAMPGEENAGFFVASCTFDEARSPQ